MCKRFTETTIWEDDWFSELSVEYKLFWFYIKDNCNHAGIWKPKTRAFKLLTDVQVDLAKALGYFNTGKQRVRLLESGNWFLEDFFLFQYVKSAKSLNLKNRVHKSVYESYIIEGIASSTVPGIESIIDDDGAIYSPEYYDHMNGILAPDLD